MPCEIMPWSCLTACQIAKILLRLSCSLNTMVTMPSSRAARASLSSKSSSFISELEYVRDWCVLPILLRKWMGNLGISPTLLDGCESQGNRYDYKVYIILNIK